jgi:hypothetical protein
MFRHAALYFSIGHVALKLASSPPVMRGLRRSRPSGARIACRLVPVTPGRGRGDDGGDAAYPFVASGVVAALMRDATTVGVVMR